MNTSGLKLSKILILLENSNIEKLEDVYFSCYGENPHNGLTRDDLHYNIFDFLQGASSEEVSRIYREVFK